MRVTQSQESQRDDLIFNTNVDTLWACTMLYSYATQFLRVTFGCSRTHHVVRQAAKALPKHDKNISIKLIAGWACDIDHPTSSVEARIRLGKIQGNPTYTLRANQPSEAAGTMFAVVAPGIVSR
ncbi:MAG: hypothetical protein R3A47_05555 [Polyangiales bacterium]